MKTVLITGASGGIGDALCKYFEAKGFRILAHARTEQTARAMTRETNRIPIWGDITVAAQVDQIAEQAAEAGSLDMLVHNAGILSRSKTPGANGLGIQAEVNVVAPAKLTKALAPLLAKSDDPKVIVVSSSAANFARSTDYTVLENPDGSSLFGHYALSKSAANALVVAMAKTFPDFRVLSTEPGFVKTKMTATNDQMPLPMRWIAKVASSTPEKAATRCFEHIMSANPESGSAVQNGKVIDSSSKPWSTKAAFEALEKLLAKADAALLRKD